MKKLFVILSTFLLAVTLPVLSACNSSTQTNTPDIPLPGEDVSNETAEGIIQDVSSVVDTSNSSLDENTTLADDATVILLDDDKTTVKGSGASYADGVLTISQTGDYSIGGTLTDGRIVVNTDGNAHLLFSGVNITSSSGAPVAIYGSKKKVITLQSGTTNTLKDSSSYTSFAPAEEAPSACLFAQKSLTMNGEGSLSVTSLYNNGIQSKNVLKMLGGNVTVSAVNNALKGNDGVIIKGGTYTLTASGDGVRSDGEEENCGYVSIEGGTLVVDSVGDCISSVSLTHILGGEFTLKAGGGASSSVRRDSISSSEVTSRKGIKSDSSVVIEGGTFTVDSLDDGIHSNGVAVISGGTLNIFCSNPNESNGKTYVHGHGIHADTSVNITGGEVNILKSYEGIESEKITLSGGMVSVVSMDDGLNASSGTSSSTGMGFGGFFGGSSSSTDCLITIEGGTLYVNATGDGIDSNGNIVMTGGVVFVDGPTSSGNGAIDIGDGNCTFVLSGGTLVAVGASGMAETPSSSSTQYVLSYTKSSSTADAIAVTSSSGEVLIEYTPTKNWQNAVISLPSFEQGSVLTLGIGGTDTQVTLSAVITSAGTAAGGTQGGFGGGGSFRPNGH